VRGHRRTCVLSADLRRTEKRGARPRRHLSQDRRRSASAVCANVLLKQSAETGNLSIHKSRSQAAGTAGARKTRLLHRKVIACRRRSPNDGKTPHDEKTRHPDRRDIPKMINLSPAIAAILLVAVSHSFTPSANSHAQSSSKKDSKGGASRGAADEQA